MLSFATIAPVGVTPPVGAAPVGQGFNLNGPDLRFILKQIKIAEQHAATATVSNPCGTLLGSGPDQIPNIGQGVELPWGLRTVDGSCNNLIAGQEHFGTADQIFPRIAPINLRDAEMGTSYTQNVGTVVDSQPRVISNLIVDQTATNPAAVAAAGEDPEITPSGAFFIPNVAPDVGLSAPYNSWFTLFGQFFDHGLDLVNKGGVGTVFVPLQSDDPLFVPGSPTNFMVLSRATHDGDHEGNNQTSPFVDQSQTYTSHPSHQVFLRRYVNNAAGRPVSNGELITAAGVGGMATWTDVKAQAASLLGIALSDEDALRIPLLATDPYGRFIPGPNGFPQLVTAGGLVEGNPASPVSAAGAFASGHAFLDDIAHHAVPGGGKVPDGDPGTVDDLDPATYDDEMLGAHFMAGDGRVNENIGLTAVHHIFHSEHNRLVEDIKSVITTEDPTMLSEWQLGAGVWNGERLFQAARFVTEMEYQHLAFEEFARKVQPMVNLFGEGGTGYHTTINPAIRAEFAHAVYRFGHSMLTESVDRVDANGTAQNIDLLDAFLNPPSFITPGQTPDEAAGSVVRGMTRQVGNELDEFVTEALRNNLLGLPLDLATLNMARARDTGIPTLNEARRQFFALSNNSSLTPYTSWADLNFSLKHSESLVNFVAAYGTHPTIVGAATITDKRAAAELIVAADPTNPSTPVDSYAFMNSVVYETTDPLTGDVTVNTEWVSAPGGVTTTGVDRIDLWVGGLAERGAVFGGLLGPTFNYVFELQMEDLQNGDRFYYLSRTAGLNLLTQLEGNSFAELIQRNTDVEGLPADSFSRPDHVFNVAALGTSGPILDDPATDYNETQLLTRMPNGTIRYSGPAHVVFNGTSGNDRVWSSEGDDTIRGNDGNDWMEGGDGADSLIGGLGDDIMNDLFGDDTLKGGDGNDALSSGQGFGGDLNQGGRGNDFIVGGNDATESFAGPGDDYVYAGDGDDTVFGDDGDDWIEGGAGAFNLLQGDNGVPFQDDPNGGHDILIGYGGEADYDAEGGNDIMLLGPGIQRNEGMLGFDMATHARDTAAGNSDMSFTGLLPPGVEVNRDRFDLVEALSGWDLNDVLRGDDRDAVAMEGHELDATGIARVAGMAALLPAGATSFTGGNILMGGDGSDLIEGRGGDDVIDGDRWLNVRISVRTNPADPDSEIGSTTRMKGLATSGNFGPGTANMTLTQAVFAGLVNPGNLVIVREIITPPSNPATIDSAVFSGPAADYTVTTDASTGTVTVTDNVGLDGTDTLRNVERLVFADTITALGALSLSTLSPVEGEPVTATLTLVQPGGVDLATLVIEWQAETAPGVWTATGQLGDTMTPDDPQVGFSIRAVATVVDNLGSLVTVIGEASGPVANVNDAPLGLPSVSSLTPRATVPITASTTAISDADGLSGVFGFQWRLNGGDIGGATAATFTPTVGMIGGTLSVVVTYTDLHGTVEALVSPETGPVGPAPAPIASATPTSLDFGTRSTVAGATTQTIAIDNTGDADLNIGAVTRTGATAGSFTIGTGCTNAVVAPGTSCAITVTFNSTTVGAKSAQISVTNNAGPNIVIPFSATVVINSAPTGTPELSNTAPQNGVALTASVGTIADADGLVGVDFNFRWQQNNVGGGGAFVDIAGATGTSFTPTLAQVGRRLRVVVTYVDNHFTPQTVNGTPTAIVGDVFVGTPANDTWVGNAGNDVATGGGGNDTLTAAGGNDIMNVGIDDGFDTVNGGAGIDTIRATADGAVIGLQAITNIEAISADGHVGVSISGSPTNNTLNLSAVTLTGIGLIDGGAGNDNIRGSAAADLIRGGDGNDTLNGEGGDDVFVYLTNFGLDTINGFDANPAGGQDKLDISALGVTSGNFNVVVGRIQQGANVRITIGANRITLTGQLLADVTAADFVLA